MEETLTYHKSCTRVITIGRKSSHAQRESGQGSDRALFRCPVVSRKHAKITFTEFGNAYITDLNSHHGTYVLHPGDIESKMIQAESPTVLADGDIVTFGKSVGRDDTFVRPVTVRISLLFGSELAPLRHGSIGPETSEKVSLNVSSGRYGIYVSSDSSSASSSEGESDVEEISPPPSSRAQFPIRGRLSNTTNSQRLRLLRHLLPPVSSCVVDLRSVSPEADESRGAFADRPAQVVGEHSEDDVSESSSELSSPSGAPHDDDAHEVNVVGAWPERLSPRVTPPPPYEFDLLSASIFHNSYPSLSLFSGSHAVEEEENTATEGHATTTMGAEAVPGASSTAELERTLNNVEDEVHDGMIASHEQQERGAPAAPEVTTSPQIVNKPLPEVGQFTVVSHLDVAHAKDSQAIALQQSMSLSELEDQVNLATVSMLSLFTYPCSFV